MTSEPPEKRIGTLRPLLLLLAAMVLAAAFLTACGGDSDEDTGLGNAATAPDFSKAIDKAPPEIAALYEGDGELVDGGIDAYEAQLAELEGHPVVVNKWASWCNPCREEFPYFQEQVAERGDEVAFMGINAKDVDAAAETFLRDNPLPYLNFTDPDESLSAELSAAPAVPVTLFYNAAGEKTYMHSGPYESADALAADIDKYAVDG